MADYNKFEKRKDSRGGSRFDRHDDRPRQMFDATCSQCGKKCEIPFKPVAGRPVYCSECFKNQKSGFNPSFAPKKFNDQNTQSFRAPQDSSATKAQFDALNVKLDKIISLLSQSKSVSEPVAKSAEPKEKKSVAKKTPVKKSKTKKK